MEKILINIIASDLDGTLLNKDFKLDSYIESCLDQLQKRKKEFVVVTGRTLHGVYSLSYLKNNPFYIIAMNGTLILDKNKNVIYKNSIGKDEVRDIYQHFSNIEYISEDKIYMSISKEEYLKYYGKWSIWQKKLSDENYLKYHLAQYVFEAPLDLILKQDILKINGLELNNDKYQVMKSYVKKYSSLVDAPFTDNVIELTNNTISKRDCLRCLCKLNGWNEDEVAAFGDGGNDIDMLTYFKNSYAPENAMETAKNAANKIVPSNTEYGVINEILKITA